MGMWDWLVIGLFASAALGLLLAQFIAAGRGLREEEPWGEVVEFPPKEWK